MNAWLPRSSLVLIAVGAATLVASEAADPGRHSVSSEERFPSGSVIFFHPDGTGANHWAAARMYFKGPDGYLNWDRLPHLALYRGHMKNNLIGTSNGGATTHAFGGRVEGSGSFGQDGNGTNAVPIRSLSGYPGSIAREAANRGIPVGLVNDGHLGEPGTGCFLAEVGNRDDWQEITRQMIQGRPGCDDTAPWVLLGGGEADTRPAGTTLVHRNHNGERGHPLDAQTSLRTDDLDLELDWNDNGSGDLSNDPARLDDWIVIKTRAEFEALRTALGSHPGYAPHVLGLFAYQDLFNDRNEEDLIARGKVTQHPADHVGPLVPPPTLSSAPGFRAKASRLVLWGDVAGQPGHNPPTFQEMVGVALTILDRAARVQADPANRRFLLVAEQEASDNFGNQNNAVGVLQALHDTDQAIGVAREYLRLNPDTLILTAADSDAGGLQVTAPYRNAVVANAESINTNTYVAGFDTNPASGAPRLPNLPDGLEGRGQNTAAPGGAKMFLSEPDALGQRMEFGILWTGLTDNGGGIVSRAEGINSGLLASRFAMRFDNLDVYRMLYTTLFGRLLDYPANPAAQGR